MNIEIDNLSINEWLGLGIDQMPVNVFFTIVNLFGLDYKVINGKVRLINEVKQ